MPDSAQPFIEQSRAFLSAEYLPKIRACVERLSPEDVWWRPNHASNSVGHLLLHLDGNLRQWIVCGVGGGVDDRNRDREFAPEAEPSPRVLLDRLAQTVADADAVLDRMNPARGWESIRTIQGRQVTELAAVFHAIEHFAMHMGQIIYITKLRTGADLAFYESDSGAMRATWTGRVRDV